jgi:hypothetical protein
MSTATYSAPTKGVVMVTPNHVRLEDRPDLQEIVNDLVALKLMAKDGILTHKSQRDLVKDLTSKEMAVVARAVASVENAARCFERPANINSPSPNNDGVKRFDAQGKPETFNR